MSKSDTKIAVVCSSNQNRSMEAHNFLSKKGYNVRSFGTGNQVRLPGPAANMPNIYDFSTTYDEMHRDLLKKDKELYPFFIRTLPNLCRVMEPGKRERHDTMMLTTMLFCLHAISSRGPVEYLKMKTYVTLRRSLIVFFSAGYSLEYSYKARIRPYTQNGILHMLDRNRRIKPRPERFQACKEHFDIIVSCEERVYDQILDDLGSRDTTENAVSHIINIDIQDNQEEATIGAFLIRDLVTALCDCDDIDDEIDEVIQGFEHQSNRTILHTAKFL